MQLEDMSPHTELSTAGVSLPLKPGVMSIIWLSGSCKEDKFHLWFIQSTFELQVTTLLGKIGEMEKARATSAEVDGKRQETESQREAVESLRQV